LADPFQNAMLLVRGIAAGDHKTMIAVNKPVGDKAITGPELKQLRAVLGDAVGRQLSLVDMAKLCGLSPGNAADTIRKWEDGAGRPTGPVAALLSIIATAYGEGCDPAVREFFSRWTAARLS
jgi:DNA-binding transcriptional regulator YiaG